MVSKVEAKVSGGDLTTIHGPLLSLQGQRTPGLSSSCSSHWSVAIGVYASLLSRLPIGCAPVWPRRVASAHPSFDPKILHPDFFVVWPFFLKCPDAQFRRAGNRCLHFWGVFSFNLAEGRTLACPAPLDCPFPSAAFQPQEPGNEATLAFSVGRRCTQSSGTTWRQCKDFSKGIVDSSAWLISGGVAACTASRVAGKAYIPVCKSCVSLALELVTMIPHSSVLGMLRAACL